MKKWIILLLSIASNAFAQNLITNGDFESGTLGGWTATDGVSIVSGSDSLSGSFSARIDQNADYSEGVISQAFATTPGRFYSIKFDDSDVNASEVVVTSSSGSTLSVISGKSGGFIANSATSTVTINGWASCQIDNVQVMESSFSKPGKYTGTVTYGVSFTGVAGVINSRKYAITARIDANGRLAGVISDGNSVSAIITDSGVFAVDRWDPLISGSVNPKTWAINFVIQRSEPNSLTGLNEVRSSTFALKYAGK